MDDMLEYFQSMTAEQCHELRARFSQKIEEMQLRIRTWERARAWCYLRLAELGESPQLNQVTPVCASIPKGEN